MKHQKYRWLINDTMSGRLPSKTIWAQRWGTVKTSGDHKSTMNHTHHHGDLPFLPEHGGKKNPAFQLDHGEVWAFLIRKQWRNARRWAKKVFMDFVATGKQYTRDPNGFYEM